jgi:hypothetical protein
MSKNTQKNKTLAIVDGMRNSKGRFFGLQVKSGEKINAQFRYETSDTVVIYDRNASRQRRIYKSNLAAMRMGSHSL